MGELKEFGGSEPIQRTAIGTAPWHRLFHSVNVSWWDHIECATGRRPFGLTGHIVPLRVEQSKKSLKPGHHEVCLRCHGNQDLNFNGICVYVICLMH